MAARSAWWTRAEALNWIMTRRSSVVASSPLKGPRAPQKASKREDRAKDSPTHWAISDALYRMQAAPAEVALDLPNFKRASEELAQAEAGGLSADAQGRFKRERIRELWPSVYGRPSKRGDRHSGKPPTPWPESLDRILMLKFIGGKRNMNRGALKHWAADQLPKTDRKVLSFSDDNFERWAAYVQRALDAAETDIRRRREQQLISESEAAERLCNVRSWRRTGRLAKRE